MVQMSACWSLADVASFLEALAESAPRPMQPATRRRRVDRQHGSNLPRREALGRGQTEDLSIDVVQGIQRGADREVLVDCLDAIGSELLSYLVPQARAQLSATQ